MIDAECRAPPSGTVTTVNSRTLHTTRYDNVESPCSCGWDKDDISKTTGEDYRKKRRYLQWIETKEFGLVLSHRRKADGGQQHTLCGIVYDRKTNKPVKKEDFD